MKHKLIKGYLVGKAIEMTIAGATVLLAKKKGWMPEHSETPSKADFIAQKKEEAARKRIARF